MKETNDKPEARSLIDIYSAKGGRDPYVIFSVGHNRTGKTTIALATALAWKMGRPDGKIIVFDPQNKFKEIADIIIPLSAHNDTNADWAKEISEMKNALLILDDSKMLFKNWNTPPGIFNLLAYRAEHGIDIMVITHHLSHTLKQLACYATDLLIFYMHNRKASQWKEKFDDFDLIEIALEEVATLVEKTGKLSNINKPLGKRFPYVHVNTQSRTMVKYNFDYMDNNLKLD